MKLNDAISLLAKDAIEGGDGCANILVQENHRLRELNAELIKALTDLETLYAVKAGTRNSIFYHIQHYWPAHLRGQAHQIVLVARAALAKCKA